LFVGIGSCGTVVYRGSFKGRPVAVKKLLRNFVVLAEREVSILQEVDNHPNVIQYYYQEARDNCLLIAIELCSASLADIIERPKQWRDIVINFDPKKALEGITSGLDHLHSLSVVHRDLKPQNILISAPQRTTWRNGKGRVGHRMLISDFGLCKKLDDDQTSFLPTTHGASAAGTRGWQAPEILGIKLEKGVDNALRSSSENIPLAHRKLTRSMDIFPLGCLFYYTLTIGGHPYGRGFERELNILMDTKDLRGVETLGEEGLKAKDLIMKMLNPEPNQR
jgi:serine/threonine-protein kinase/endoribonuclease IRE1